MIHGGDIYRNKVNMDFSVNVNPLGIPESVEDALTEALKSISYYPDPKAEKLTSAIADHFSISSDCVLCGNGASELIMALMHALKPGRILLPAPSFGGYRWAASAAEVDDLVEVFLPKDNDFTVDDEFCSRLIRKIEEGVDLLILTNPNNPTGKLWPPPILEDVLNACLQNEVPVLIDECFMELTADPGLFSLTSCLDQWPNLLILRAFTKSFSIPGIRLGYMLSADKSICEKIRKQLPEWNVSGLAQAAGVAALEEVRWLDDARKLISKEAAYLQQELSRLGYVAIGTDTNFILFRDPLYPGRMLYQSLLMEGILIRDCSNYSGLEAGWYRIAVRRHEENERLVEVLRELS